VRFIWRRWRRREEGREEGREGGRLRFCKGGSEVGREGRKDIPARRGS